MSTPVECSICLEECVAYPGLVATKCKHVFHRVCLKKWLSKNNTCPNCKETNPWSEFVPERKICSSCEFNHLQWTRSVLDTVHDHYHIGELVVERELFDGFIDDIRSEARLAPPDLIRPRITFPLVSPEWTEPRMEQNVRRTSRRTGNLGLFPSDSTGESEWSEYIYIETHIPLVDIALLRSILKSKSLMLENYYSQQNTVPIDGPD